MEQNKHNQPDVIAWLRKNKVKIEGQRVIIPEDMTVGNDTLGKLDYLAKYHKYFIFRATTDNKGYKGQVLIKTSNIKM